MRHYEGSRLPRAMGPYQLSGKQRTKKTQWGYGHEKDPGSDHFSFGASLVFALIILLLLSFILILLSHIF